MADRIYLNDSAVIETDLTDDETGEPILVDSVSYQFNDPNGIPLFVRTLPLTPFIGQLVVLTGADGGFVANDVVEWNGAQWNKVDTAPAPILEENNSVFVFPAILTNDVGLYQGRAQFTTQDGLVKSTRVAFEVLDPMETLSPTVVGRIIDHAWLKLEDLFDSELGGPWMRDKTLNSFNKDKLAALLPDALYTINNEYQPTTTFDETNWPEAHIPLAAQGLLVEAIYHMIRTYVEQPLPSGGEMSWFDRRDYMQRWQSVLTVEEQKLFRLLDVFKIQFTGFGSTSILIGGYSSPITRLSKAWRTRYPRWIGPWGN
jgi:hypothetical protein